ncbi:phosphatidylserine decarboxylase [Spizellomyces sp. 'palustris']|nr:phosphatidylserine decarboxylase [Spizellomyces sp. 'palustris']
MKFGPSVSVLPATLVGPSGTASTGSGCDEFVTMEKLSSLPLLTTPSRFGIQSFIAIRAVSRVPSVRFFHETPRTAMLIAYPRPLPRWTSGISILPRLGGCRHGIVRSLYQQPKHGWWGEQKEAFKKAKDILVGTRIVWYPIPISLGIACLAFMHYLHIRRREEKDKDHDAHVVALEGPWHVHAYGYLPLRTISRMWGWLNNLTVPLWLREPLYKSYATMFGCNLEEMEDPDLTHYPNLAAFFYRTLKPGARPLDPKAPLVSPADGTVLHFGLITSQRKVEQIKGITYSLDALLGGQRKPDSSSNPIAPAAETAEEEVLNVARKTHSELVVSENEFADINSINYSLDKMLGDEPGQYTTGSKDGKGNPIEHLHAHAAHQLKPGNALFFAVIYLAPGDYHRFHSPSEWIVEKRRHFSGELYSVSPLAVNLIRNLFVLNERVVLMGDWQHGFFSMIPVGATNVGSIKIDFDPDLRTNLSKRQLNHPPGTYDEREYRPPVRLHKGDQMGGFMLGSTVVLVFEAPTEFEFMLEAGQKVKVGQAIGKLK